MFLGEEKGERVNLARARELAGSGAQVIGTACPFCQSMFRDALGTMTATGAAAAGYCAACQRRAPAQRRRHATGRSAGVKSGRKVL